MQTTIVWGTDAVTLTLVASPGGPARLVSIGAGPPDVVPDAGPPLVELATVGDGGWPSNVRQFETVIGTRLRPVDRSTTTTDGWEVLRLRQRDPVSGLAATSVFRARPGVPAVQTWTEVTNEGAGPVRLQVVSSMGCPLGVVGPDAGALDLTTARTGWCAESRWTTRALLERDAFVVAPFDGWHRPVPTPSGSELIASTGTWSTGTVLPTAAVSDRRTGRSLAWQIEHNGSWACELGAGPGGVPGVVLTGPADVTSGWLERLEPGATFVSVPASVAWAPDGPESAIAALTGHRRALAAERGARTDRLVVFNNFLNALWGDPTAERLVPLVDAAASVGAEVFCIDAGWYDDAADWWDGVGAWEPSARRFPGGLREVVDRIVGHGMLPGIWLEPEVVGVRSAMADRLPRDAFLQRDGERVRTRGRFHLDLRHPAAVAHLDAVVDGLVSGLGIGMLKLDYNVAPGTGTDVAAASSGAGLLGHNRAHLAWLDGVRGRHPGLLLENCASGAMRMDWALLPRFDLQSTSDQTDGVTSASIVAAAPASVLPEQCGNWAAPDPGTSAREVAFWLSNGMLGRLVLAGRIDLMDAEQRQLVAEGVAAHRSLRDDVAQGLPWWPLGLPGWDDRWVALGMRSEERSVLTLWNRGAAGTARLAVPHLRAADVAWRTVFPAAVAGETVRWDAAAGVLEVTLPDGPVAVTVGSVHPAPGPVRQAAAG